VNEPQPNQSRQTAGKPPSARRNLRTALLLALAALGFYVAFFYAVSHRGG
jgi:hypothetical protein